MKHCPHGPMPELQITVVDAWRTSAKPFLIYWNSMPSYSAPFMADISCPEAGHWQCLWFHPGQPGLWKHLCGWCAVSADAIIHVLLRHSPFLYPTAKVNILPCLSHIQSKLFVSISSCNIEPSESTISIARKSISFYTFRSIFLRWWESPGLVLLESEVAVLVGIICIATYSCFPSSCFPSTWV